MKREKIREEIERLLASPDFLTVEETEITYPSGKRAYKVRLDSLLREPTHPLDWPSRLDDYGIVTIEIEEGVLNNPFEYGFGNSDSPPSKTITPS